MARPTLMTHPKFAKLVHRLRGRAMARGVLELIWEAGYASGDPSLGDAESVEALADWRGEAGDLVGHLVACGFLDRDGDRYFIHDLADHAPDYVVRRMARERQRQDGGMTISQIRSAAASKRNSDAANEIHLQQTSSTDRSLAANVQPPSPSPSPALRKERDTRAPAYVIPPLPPGRPFPVGAATYPFIRVADAYPNKLARQAAAAVFQRLADDHPGGEGALADEITKALPALLAGEPYCNGPKFCKSLDVFLAEMRWRDPPTPATRPAAARAGPPRDVRVGYAAAEVKVRKSGEVDL